MTGWMWLRVFLSGLLAFGIAFAVDNFVRSDPKMRASSTGQRAALIAAYLGAIALVGGLVAALGMIWAPWE